jgi:serine protease Do
MPSIVAITNMSETQVQNWFGQLQNYQSKSAGSGIIVSQDDKNLYIATNNHVVADSKSITVQFCDLSTVTAEVKGTDAGDDLAVVAVKLSDIKGDTAGKIKVATVGNSDDLKAGQAAVAIGNALGYGQSVTTGVISAVNRDVSVKDDTSGASTTSKLIQTDAAINPGNSGGALLNLSGEVIGINSIKYSDTSVEGMGYAIPINTATPIIEKLINREVVKSSDTAYLGISGVDVSSSVASTYNMPEGIYIYQVVDGSAAANAGLAKGDVITAFDGTKVNSTAELEEQMKYYATGTKVDVTIQRPDNSKDGKYKEQKVSVTLGSKR